MTPAAAGVNLAGSPARTNRAPRVSHSIAGSRAVAYGAILLYGVLAALTAYRHEPWADEAQSWLLARDAGLIQLWTGLLHYEGTPGLWQTLLHVLIGLGVPYAAINFVAVIAGTGAAWLLIRHAPLPFWIRVTLPFTWYLFYQYGIVARSYSLLPLLTFGCAILYSRTPPRPYLFTLLVCMTAAVSLGGFVLAVLIYGDFLLRERRVWLAYTAPERKRTLAATAVFVPVAFLLAWSAWPAKDNLFVKHLNLSAQHLLVSSLGMIQYAFTGEWLTTIAVLALSLPFLLRGGALPLFLAATVCLCTVHSVIYMNAWHIGALSLAWLFCMWKAAARVPLTGFAAGSLALVVGFQGYWTIQSVRYDWNHAYSGSKDAVRFLKEHPEVGNSGLCLVSFSSEAVKPWFSAAELGRMTHGKAPAYWDWSSKGNGNDPLPLITSSQFGYLLAGYKLPSEEAHWAGVANIGGFQLVRHFEGNLFWRTSIFEPEGFDLYRRVTAPRADDLSASLTIANPATARQLITGFHDVEAQAWRWTAQKFTVALPRPVGAESRGARLTFHFSIPDSQIRELGPMTLSAAVNGHALGGDRFVQPGDLAWTRDIPPGYLNSALTVVAFSLDKVRPSSTADDRELGVVAKAVSIELK